MAHAEPLSPDGGKGNSLLTASGECLQFRIPGLLLCVPLEHVERVLPLVEWQPVPGAADFLRGLLNVHGEAVPVVDLGTRLGHRARPRYDLDTPILLCRANGRSAGLIVSEIAGVIDIKAVRGQVAQLFGDADLPFVAAFDTANGLSLLLNLDRILDFSLDSIAPGYTEALTADIHASL